MNNLYPLIYNNYSTRIIKKEDSLQDYLPYLCGDVARNINFVPGNGINTTQILNSLALTISSSVDYLVVCDTETGEIESRWFVMDCARTTHGQYQLSLRRDLIADYLDDLMSSNLMIKRGKVLDSDPAIFNDEGLKFNQIKTSEALLKDYTGIPWIVAYVSPDVAAEHGNVYGNIEGFYTNDYSSMAEFPLSQYIGKNVWAGSFDRMYACIWFTANKDPIYKPYPGFGTMRFFLDGNFIADSLGVSAFDGIDPVHTVNLDVDSVKNFCYQVLPNWQKQLEVQGSNIYSQVAQTIENEVSVSEDTYQKLLGYDQQIVRIAGTLYRINVTVNDVNQRFAITSNGSAIDTAVKSALKSYANVTQYVDQATVILTGGNILQISLTQLPDATATFRFKFGTTDLSNPETPYGIICTPYADYYSIGDGDAGNLSKENRLKIFQALGSVSGLTYDMQILPYCPIQGLSIEGTTITKGTSNCQTIAVTTIDPAGNDGDYKDGAPNYDNWVDKGTLTTILVAPTSNISFDIRYTIKIDDLKRQNATDMWRLCSPNYASIFEFNAAKFFDGSYTVIKRFHVDMSSKPYTPYIHVNPEWGGLYGGNFNDARGLICSGDFSIDRITDNWETYQYNNKNWQASFDRQIDTMEFQRDWELRDARVNGVLGGIGAAAGGFMLGGIGGAVGLGIGSAASSIYNYREQQALTQRGIDDARMQFQFTNQNMQAQPYSLQKVSTINNNNKLFPILEYYTCTDQEKTLFTNYISYYGMNVNRVGKMSDYVYYGEQDFIQGSLLKNTLIEGSTAIYNAINQELNTGIYLERK